jgi:hypothetical protein
MNFIEIFLHWCPDHGDGSFEVSCFLLLIATGILSAVREQRKRSSRTLALGGKVPTL